MKKVLIEYKTYSFKELSRKSKDQAIADYYEAEEYPFLEDDLKEQLKGLLKRYAIEETGKTELGYSLSYCQGDGLNFTGRFTWKGHDITITHTWRYPFAKASDIIDVDPEGGENDPPEEFKTLYLEICCKLEKAGYAILDYRMDDNEFSEHCEANGYRFLANGKRFSL